MPQIKASAQYDDWNGTSAADDADHLSLTSKLRADGLVSDDDFVVAVELYIGETHGGRVGSPSIAVLVVPLGVGQTVDQYISGARRPELRRISLEGMSLVEFLGLFKRFAVTLTRGNVDGLEYVEVDT